MDIAAVVLAAGASTRMKSKVSKVMHNLAGRPIISYPIELAKSVVGKGRVIVVRSPSQEDLKKYLKETGVDEAVQQKPLGTGHAVLAARKSLADFKGYVLCLCGDVPLPRKEMIKPFVEAVVARSALIGVLTMVPENAAPYGRIVRDLDGRVLKIVEARDASEEERKIREVNSGVLCFKSEWLFKSLAKLSNENAKGEYYLTDLVGMALKEGSLVFGFKGEPASDLSGINTRVDLAMVAEMMRDRINKGLMLAGVGIRDFRNTYVDADVKIGGDTEVMPYSFILGDTKIGENCTIENGVVIKNSIIGDGVHVKANSVIEDSRVDSGAIIGPFARIRPGSRVGKDVRVGNFVELKKCDMKEGSKANHLTYLGDAVIGKKANIGCGTITCNYDGFAKYKTVIGEGAFVGSDTQFVAPVKVGRGAIIGAGSTITKNVPADALALTRVEQRSIQGYAKKRKRAKKSGTSR